MRPGTNFPDNLIPDCKLSCTCITCQPLPLCFVLSGPTAMPCFGCRFLLSYILIPVTSLNLLSLAFTVDHLKVCMLILAAMSNLACIY
ncbi:hypothetical protein BDV41DRAFT_222412 [Aspergillus transmontanensis]|uniref:Uncharacterized protein n=1 Tax=Aspergillus transmontanensis TaxID=1034304 RepID=A0A5N6W0L2_9EURO|nr:hypothetical protein BDV41DRAFT_222412 [Aspergillus transmontanensis]